MKQGCRLASQAVSNFLYVVFSARCTKNSCTTMSRQAGKLNCLSFNWTKSTREPETTIQTIFGHRCSPHLSFTIDTDSIVGCSPSHACYPTSVLLGHSPSKRIEYASHCSITVTQCTVTTASHFLFAVSGSVPDPMGAGECDVLLHEPGKSDTERR